MDDYQKQALKILNDINEEIKLAPYKNQGNGGWHFCNICNTQVTFRKNMYRQGWCPNCGSVERHRHCATWLWPRLPSLFNANILHFAPEPCLSPFFTSIPTNYIGANYSPNSPHSIDIRNISFASDLFDLIIANQVLEHTDKDVQAISELYRVCRKGGHVLLTVPMLWQYQERLLRRIDGTYMTHLFGLDPDKTFQLADIEPTPANNLKYYGQHDHLRIYGKQNLRNMLEQAGFTVEILDPHNYPLNYVKRLEIIDDLIVCKK